MSNKKIGHVFDTILQRGMYFTLSTFQFGLITCQIATMLAGAGSNSGCGGGAGEGCVWQWENKGASVWLRSVWYSHPQTQ